MTADTTPAAVRAALSGDLAELRRGLEQLSDQVHEINVALTGNGLGVSHGLVGCVQRLEKQAEEQNTRIGCVEGRWQKAKWALIGIAAGSGLGGAGLTALILKAAGG